MSKRAPGKDATTLEPSGETHVARVQILSEQTFGSEEKADRWLRRPLAELGNESPLAVAETKAGARVVEAILGKIAWGAAA
jgi:putative toxin-antitoxin system antitoxin component (TIGR02293 family)